MLTLPPVLQLTHVVVETGGKQVKLEADLVVAGIGAKPCTEMFEGQLELEAGGIKVRFTTRD